VPALGPGYWDGVAHDFGAGRDTLWRAHSDEVNTRLLRCWLPHRSRRALKTDLFDEAVTDGLYPALAERAERVTGIDLSEAAVRAAAARHPGLEALQADVRRLPFGDAEFDALVSTSTLDHFPALGDLLAGVRELHRVLEPGGRLVITLDNRANPVVALRNALPYPLLNRVGLVPYYVGATLGPRGLRRALVETGFDVLEMRAIMHCPRVPAVVAARVLRRRGERAQRAFLRSLLAWEALGRLPTAPFSGYFIGAKAVRR
jgi:SAM-dependent methyltransferase